MNLARLFPRRRSAKEHENIQISHSLVPFFLDQFNSVAWHPLCESVFASGGMDGTLVFWNVGSKGTEEPAAKVPFAHDMAIWDLKWHPAGHMLATGSNDRQTKFWARNRLGSTAGLSSDDVYVQRGGIGSGAGPEANEILNDEIQLGNHVGIVIGRRGQTIISMQRSTGCKMHVDQVRRTLLIQGTAKQLQIVRKRVGALLDRVSSEDQQHHGDSHHHHRSSASRGTAATGAVSM